MRVLNYEFENYNGLQLIISSHPQFEYIQLNSFELGMLKQNSLPNFLDCEIEVIDNEYKFHYHVQNLKKFHHHMQVNCTTQLDLYHMTSSLLDAIKSSYGNMLTPDGCVIHKDAIFYDEKKNEILLTYLPLQHKEKLESSLLHWFIYWSSEVKLIDYKHLHKVLVLIGSKDFTIDRIQDELMEYIYTTHTSLDEHTKLNDPPIMKSNERQVTPKTFKKINTKDSIDLLEKQSTLNNILPNQVENIDTAPQLHNAKTMKNLQSHSLEESSLDNNQLLPLRSTNNNKLRFILYLILVLCVPVAVWLQLYSVSPTLVNLCIAIGTTISALAFIVIIVNRKMKKQDSIEDLLADDDTGEHHPPYNFLDGYQVNVQQIHGVDQQEDHTSPQIEQAIAIKDHKHHHYAHPTVQLGMDNATEQIGGKQVLVILCRKHLHDVTEYTLSEQAFVVGRSIEGVHLNDQYSGISRLHVQFEYHNGLVIMKDLGSRNGTFLNDKLITPYKNYSINEHDKIQLVDRNGPIYLIRWE